mmetsp:Transcript_4679/g.14164  ORF Transcript_4679/g.14164 Transcript_4679/m.14164 type:complete len:249 (+) Transcript_4679:2557-3303(+)
MPGGAGGTRVVAPSVPSHARGYSHHPLAVHSASAHSRQLHPGRCVPSQVPCARPTACATRLPAPARRCVQRPDQSATAVRRRPCCHRVARPQQARWPAGLEVIWAAPCADAGAWARQRPTHAAAATPRCRRTNGWAAGLHAWRARLHAAQPCHRGWAPRGCATEGLAAARWAGTAPRRRRRRLAAAPATRPSCPETAAPLAASRRSSCARQTAAVGCCRRRWCSPARLPPRWPAMLDARRCLAQEVAA